jgi:hypothetical protein
MPHIQVPEDSSNARVVHVVGGTPQTVFAFAFPFFAIADIKVYKDGAAVSSGFTVAGAGATVDGGFESGSVAFSAAQSNCTIVIERDVALSRTDDFPYPSPVFNIKVLNTALDRIFAIFQQFRRLFARTLRQPAGDTVAIGELPAAALRANKFLGFDATGAAVAASPGTLALAAGDVTGEKIAAGAVDLSKLAAEVIAALAGGSEAIVAGEAIADRDLIYQDVFNQRGAGANRYYKVDADAVSPVRISPRIGIALGAIASGASGLAQVRAGAVSGFSGLTPGLHCYASGTAGIITQTAPAIPASGTQNATRDIGTALSATAIDFTPHNLTTFTGRGTAVAVDGTITLQHWTDTGARERSGGEGAYLVQAVASSLVPGANGTRIGDFTGNSGLAGIFDGITNQDNVGCGYKPDATFGYAGKTFAPGKRIAQAVVWGSNNIGYVVSINPTVTLVLRGKTGAAPASRTDGTSLGSISFTDTENESGNPRTIVSSDTTTVWDHVWIDFSHNGVASNCFFAEIQFTELTGVARDEPLTIGGSVANASATDRVNVRYDDGAGANADTRTTFINRTGATRDLAVEVAL